jgi:opacity protein-like surface antigen
MGSRMLSAVLVVASFAAAAAFPQTVPSAYQGRLPFTIGGGASNLNVDWGQNRMFGYSIWGDWHPGSLPRLLDGLGVEAEARDLDFGRSSHIARSFRQDTLGGGLIYSYRRFARVRPYGKFLIDYGRLDDGTGIVTDKVYAPALGFEYHAIQRLWVRADYEYQIWPNLLNGQNSGYYGKSLDPQGFTLGVSYDFRSFRFFR